MSKLRQLQLQHFRNIHQAWLTLSPGLNVIVGDNAAGKTSLLEALWVLSSGRSFRAAQPHQLIAFTESAYTVFAEVEQSGQAHKIGLSRSQESLSLKLDGQAVKTQLPLAEKLPIQLLTPESHRLLEEGPKARRQFIDWGCFHYDKHFMPAWRQYQRALKQRNRALKQHFPKDQIQLWDAQLIASAEEIHNIRKQYVEALTPYVLEFCQALMPELTSEAKLFYRPGWPQASGHYRNALEESFQKDQTVGHTQHGSHRADVRFRFDGQEARTLLSRGQQKLFVCALLLAQASLYEKEAGEAVIMLIDDLPAELDAHHRKTLLQLLDMLTIQTFVTTTALSLIPTEILSDYQAWQISKGAVTVLAKNDEI